MSKRPSKARDVFPPLLTQEDIYSQRYPGKRGADEARSDRLAYLAV